MLAPLAGARCRRSASIHTGVARAAVGGGRWRGVGGRPSGRVAWRGGVEEGCRRGDAERIAGRRPCRLPGERRRSGLRPGSPRSSLPRRDTVEFFLVRPMFVFSFLCSLVLEAAELMDAHDRQRVPFVFFMALNEFCSGGRSGGRASVPHLCSF